MSALAEVEAYADLLAEVQRLTLVPDPAPPISLRDFIAAAWPVLEPASPFVPNWHIDAIAEHLEAVTNGEVRNLLINIPPRHGKSLIVSVFWPVWSWIFAPATRWLFSSYAQPLATRDALKSRRLIQSPWFRREYGDRFRLADDQNLKMRYDNDHTGYRIATSVGGTATGEGGDFIVVDDPIKADEASSATLREAVLTWWDETMSTRLNDPKHGAKVIVMQRLHERDLAGHVLEQGGYEHLKIPVEYEPTDHVTGIGWSDPRTAPGELLWPARFGEAENAEAKVRLGSYGYAGQMQQRPAPRGGGMFKRHWWRRYRALPKLTRVAQFLDSAFKTGVANDPSGIATWAAGVDGNYYVLDYWEAKLAYPDLMRACHDVNATHRPRAPILPLVIEDKASGQSALQTLARPLPVEDGPPLPRLTVSPFPDPTSEYERRLAALSKEARAEQVTPIVEAGQVYLPEGAPWVEAFIANHEGFPNVAHDEPVDTTSMALIRLSAPPPPRGGRLVTLSGA